MVSAGLESEALEAPTLTYHWAGHLADNSFRSRDDNVTTYLIVV